MDPSLLQDFLTESNELIEKLDADLVTLERVDDLAHRTELLHGIFRALHTIKGAASFLGLTALTTFAHAAEDALNRLRKGEVDVTTEVMDAMLQSVDVLRGMLDEVAAGETITAASDRLIDTLREIVGAQSAASRLGDTGDSTAASSDESSNTGDDTLLSLPPEKADLLEFMVADLQEATQSMGEYLEEVGRPASCGDAAQQLSQLAENIFKTGDFFDLHSLTHLAKLAQAAAAKLPQLSESIQDEVLVRLWGIKVLMEEQAVALDRSRALVWPLETLGQRLETLLQNKPLDATVANQHDNDPVTVLQLDGVLEARHDAAAPSADPVTDPAGADSVRTAAGDKSSGTFKGANAPVPRSSVGEQTIRVEVSRLESLLNLVGRLVLNKNRVLSLMRRICEHELPHEVEEHFAATASDLDQLTSELQVGVMRTRMQPLAKLFDRYPRVIRDMARMTDKKFDLEIVGKDTEVDKSVLEVLADPLVHILRNSADHGIESPEKRLSIGKRQTGSIRLSAEHQGSHVRVEITDDGKGLDRDVIGKMAIERGLVSADQLAAMADEDVFRFIFAAGLSTAEKVTDLSGRGVGMDVVRTNIARINGTINVSSVKGRATTIEILIPLTVAIMPAMMVGVGRHLYAVPLATIVEIVKPEDDVVHSVRGQPVMRLRDTVLPLLDLRVVLQETDSDQVSKFAVVVGAGRQRVGLVVDRLIGQREIVIKPLDDRYTTGGPFSGATICEDGDVSLILDVLQLIRHAQKPDRAAA